MSDYKDDIQAIAEELAQRIYMMEFYALTSAGQQFVYDKALHEYAERMADRADYLRKAAREDELR